MIHMSPSLKKIAVGVGAAAIFMLIYNKVPAVRRALGGA
jgi:hypothetical protein